MRFVVVRLILHYRSNGEGTAHHDHHRHRRPAVRFTQRLVDAGIAPSTGSVGDSFDALAENLWSTLKIELMYWPATTFATRAEAEAALFRYIDEWYSLSIVFSARFSSLSHRSQLAS